MAHHQQYSYTYSKWRSYKPNGIGKYSVEYQYHAGNENIAK